MNHIQYTKDVILGNLDSSHDCIYYSSNEDLKDLFSSISFRGKDVLSVLGSSDQVFSIYDKDPKTIDTFDINLLAPYYFYLRKWSILNFNEYYPNVFSNGEIKKILDTVHPIDEQERKAYQYWREYLKNFSSFFTKFLFFYDRNAKKNEIKDLKKIKERLLSDPFSFHCMDLANDKLIKKYNSIVISNILEYYPTNSAAMKRIVSHLYDMLEEDGEVVVSYLMNLGSTSNEFYAFRNLFHSKILHDSQGNDIGCVYKKKRR